MFDRDYVGAWDLNGKDAVVTIAKVAPVVLNNGKTKNKKPVLWFVGAEKGLPLNKTNAKCIAAMYGNDTEQWIGKRIAIYGTKTDVGGEQVDCIRVRPGVPAAATKKNGKAESEPSPSAFSDADLASAGRTEPTP